MEQSRPTAQGTLAAISGVDWSRTPLGPIDAWPHHRRAIVALILRARPPIATLWGTAGTPICNEAYAAAFAAPDRPGCPGVPALEDWQELAGCHAEMLREVMQAGRALVIRNRPAAVMRNGAREEVSIDLDCSPIPREHGEPAGILVLATETTGRRRAEAGLAGARAQVQLAFESGGIIGSWAWDVPRDRLTGDAGFAKALGLPASTLEGGTSLAAMLEAIHPDDRHRIDRLLQDAASRHAGLRAQFRTPDAQAGGRWLEIGGRCGLEAEGHACQCRGVLVDIDERRRAEQRLAASEASLRMAADAAEIGIWDLDIGTDRLVWSHRIQAMFGIAPGTPYSMADFYAQLHPADREATVRAFTAAIDPAMRQLYDVEYRVIGRDDGVLRWVAAKGRGLFDDGGVCIRAVGTGIDITQRVESEARRLFLAALSDRLRDLSDPHEAVGCVERALQAMLPAASVRLLPGEQDGARPGAGQMKPIFIRRHGAISATLLVEAGETRRWSEQEVDTCREAAERGWTAVERAGAEAALRDLAATLEQRVEQRTAELQAAEAALRQAQKMEAVGQLTGGIAHDFNNMLSVVIGGLGLAKRRLARGDTAVERFLDAATEGAERAAALTQRLLAFSRQQPLRPQSLDAGELVHGMTDLLSRALGEQIQMETRLAPGLWHVCVDPLQLENALLNLAVNARDAMDGAGRLLIEVRNETAGGRDQVVVAVTDTGTGMTPEVAARAFDPFFTTKEVGRGSGLGLSQVYGFATQSGGRVHIRSVPGDGTTVSLHLRRQDDAGLPGEAPSADAQASSPGRGETVLVVEDDERVRQLSVAAVRELGYRVRHAASGKAALDLLDAHEDIDLLLTDVVMPEMNGRELAEEARRRRPGLRVLYASGFSGTRLLPQADLLPKPFTMEQLAARLREVLDRAHPPEPPGWTP